MSSFTDVFAGDNVNAVIRKTISRLQSELISIIRGDLPTSTSFISSCSTFDSFIHSHEESLDQETWDMLAELTAPGAAFSSARVKLDDQKASSTARLSSDLVSILEDKTSKLSIHDPASTTPAYLEPSARWLKDNLSNPYPSTQLRLDIARRTGTELKDLNAWFTDARKRIGWNDLRRRHFDNKRARIVEAATLFFSPAGSAHCLPLHIKQEFSSIAIRTSQLYEKFAKSQLAHRLDNAADQNRYPTPQSPPSPSASTLRPISPSSSFYESSPSAAGRKRSRSDSPEFCEDEPSPSSKRFRRQDSGSTVATGGFPSPAPSNEADTFFTPCTSPAPSPAHNVAPSLPVQSTSSNKRKRCVSEEFHYPTAKRHQPRAQAVSDPLPTTVIQPLDSIDFATLDSFFSPLTPVVSTELPDSSIPLEITFGSLCDPFQFSTASASAAPQSAPVSVPLVAPMDAALSHLDDVSSFHYTDAPLSTTFDYLGANPGQLTFPQNDPLFNADFFNPSLYADIDFSQVDHSIAGPSGPHQLHPHTQMPQHAEPTLSDDEARAALDEAARLEAQAQALRARARRC